MTKIIIGLIALSSLLSSSFALALTRECVVFFSPEGARNDSYYYQALTISKILKKKFEKQGVQVTKNIHQANIGIKLWSIPVQVGEQTIDNGPFGTSKRAVYADGIMLYGIEGGKVILIKDYETTNLTKAASAIIHDLKCE